MVSELTNAEDRRISIAMAPRERRALREYLRSVEARIVSDVIASENASPSINSSEQLRRSIRRVVNAESETFALIESFEPQRKANDSILRVLLIVAAVMAVGAAVLLAVGAVTGVFSGTGNVSAPPDALSAMVGIALGGGLLGSGFAFISAIRSYNRAKNESRRFAESAGTRRQDREVRLVMLLSSVEDDARRLVEQLLGPGANELPLGDLIEFLVSGGVWTVHDIEAFRVALRTRNSILHDSQFKVDTQFIEDQLRSVERASVALRDANNHVRVKRR